MDAPGNIVAVFRAVSEREWDDLFQALAQETAMKIESTPKEELASLQVEIRTLRVLGNWIKTQRQRSPRE